MRRGTHFTYAGKRKNGYPYLLAKRANKPNVRKIYRNPEGILPTPMGPPIYPPYQYLVYPLYPPYTPILRHGPFCDRWGKGTTTEVGLSDGLPRSGVMVILFYAMVVVAVGGTVVLGLLCGE